VDGAPAPAIPSLTRGAVTHDAETWRTLDALWRLGELDHLLDPNQLGMYQGILACPVLQYVIEAGRKVGKSWLLGVIAFEACLRHPRGRVNYAAPTGKECVEITLPIMRQIAELAPEDCRPTWVPSKSHWEFPNGAFIVLFGADDEESANKGRGPESVVNIVDEGGFTPVLNYLVESVLAPQTLQALSEKGMFAKRRSPWLGRTIIASSPPVSPGHDFATIADAAARVGAYVNRDVYTHGRMTRAEIDAYLTQRAASRGLTLEEFKETSDYQREYGAMRVLDTNLAVIPEFPKVKAAICVARPRPPHFDLYIAGDPGMDDLTGVLFAVSDFRRSKLLIEHELLLTKANTKTIADEVLAVLVREYLSSFDAADSMRVVLEKDFAFVRRPFSAVIDDATGRICADMQQYHGLDFSPADTKDREASINTTRLEIGGRHIEIHPRCVGLIRQLGTAVRTKVGGDMARSARDGHFDLVSALRYLVRSWDKQHNPYPADYGFDPTAMARRDPPKPRQSLSDAFLEGTSLSRRR
jgi:hypothetical protein